jgi:hypothetical protein
MGYALPSQEVRIQWVPQEKDLTPLKDLAKLIAEEINKIT